jgi:hypothetical protein
MDRYRAAAAFLGGGIVQLDAIGDAAVSVEHHRPGQLGDLAARSPALTDSRIMTRSRCG